MQIENIEHFCVKVVKHRKDYRSNALLPIMHKYCELSATYSDIFAIIVSFVNSIEPLVNLMSCEWCNINYKLFNLNVGWISMIYWCFFSIWKAYIQLFKSNVTFSKPNWIYRLNWTFSYYFGRNPNQFGRFTCIFHVKCKRLDLFAWSSI